MGNYFSHQDKDELIQELNYSIKALRKRVDELENGQQVKDLVLHNEFLESQVEVLHKDIANIHFNQTIGWTETNS
mgnify:FL=1